MSSLDSLTAVQKRALLKIAIELVKADNKIHSKEVSVLDSLQERLHLNQEELDLIHYIPLADAAAALRDMEADTVEEVMDVFNTIMRVDSEVDFEEKLLLTAVTMSCRRKTSAWARILSVTDLDLDIPDRQIVFLEKSECASAHKVLDNSIDNLLISKAFRDIGLHLFYLPNVLKDLGLVGGRTDNRFGLLQKSLGYLMPAGDKIKVDTLKESLGKLKTETFFKVVVTRFGLVPGDFPFEAFLLIRIRSGVVLDDENAMHSTADFFCLDISSEIRNRIHTFISEFGDDSYLLPYEGYYRILFDCFSSESKMNSEICLDKDYHFTLPSLEKRRIRFESSPQARTLYLLLLKYGQDGITQETFRRAVEYLESPEVQEFVHGDSFDMDGFEASLGHGDDPWRNVIYDTVRIYRSISSKDERSPRFPAYITSILSHRSTLKTYLNRGFDSVQELSDKQLYHVLFDKDTDAYRLGIGLSMFQIQEGGKAVPLGESRFWNALR